MPGGTQQNLTSILAAVVQVAAIIAATVIAVHNDAGYTGTVTIALTTVIAGSSIVSAVGHYAQAQVARALILSNGANHAGTPAA